MEAEALQDALSGLETFEAPELRCAPNREKWRRQIHLHSLFEIAESYYEHSAVRHICHAAGGRLPCRQREVVELLFFQGGEPDELAEEDRASRRRAARRGRAARARRLRALLANPHTRRPSTPGRTGTVAARGHLVADARALRALQQQSPAPRLVSV